MNDIYLELDHMQRVIAGLVAHKADLEARLERMFRKGVVTDVDPTKHLYRQQIGLDENGQPVKSPWLPYSQQAGARKNHSCPSVGEQYLCVNPDGSSDFTQAVGIPHGWSDANPSPSTDPKADVVTRGTTTDTTTQTSRTISVGKSSIVIDGDTITLTATRIITIGETHLGSAGGVPAAQQGTVDTGGFVDVGNLATKVFVT